MDLVEILSIHTETRDKTLRYMAGKQWALVREFGKLTTIIFVCPYRVSNVSSDSNDNRQGQVLPWTIAGWSSPDALESYIMIRFFFKVIPL